MKKIISAIILTIHIGFSYCQVLPKLSFSEMQEDYNFFFSIIKDINPQLEIRKEVQNINILDSLEKYRTLITGCNDTKDFVLLMNKAANLCSDQHIWVADVYPPKMNSKELKLNKKYHKIIKDRKSKYFALPSCIFVNDSLYFTESFTVTKFGKHDTVLFAGSKLLNINGLNPKEYFLTILNLKNNFKWDYNNNFFYSDRIIADPIELKNKELNFEIDNSGSISKIQIKYKHRYKHIYTVKSGSSYKVYKHTLLSHGKYTGGMPAQHYSPNVVYFNKDSILYIRIPRMDDEDYFPDELIKKGKDLPINKIILDIRNNGGGSDWVWINILQNLLDKSLAFESISALKNPSLYADAIEKGFGNSIDFDTVAYADYKFLPRNTYKLLKGESVIEPNSNSLNYAGKFYILQNERCYSAAGSLISLAETNERFINVGLNTGVLMGGGIDILTFKMPNSHLSFTLEPILDLTNVKKPIDAFHDKLKIKVDPSITEWIKYYDSFFYSLDEFLYERDPWFKIVLKQ